MPKQETLEDEGLTLPKTNFSSTHSGSIRRHPTFQALHHNLVHKRQRHWPQRYRYSTRPNRYTIEYDVLQKRTAPEELSVPGSARMRNVISQMLPQLLHPTRRYSTGLEARNRHEAHGAPGQCPVVIVADIFGPVIIDADILGQCHTVITSSGVAIPLTRTDIPMGTDTIALPKDTPTISRFNRLSRITTQTRMPVYPNVLGAPIADRNLGHPGIVFDIPLATIALSMNPFLVHTRLEYTQGVLYERNLYPDMGGSSFILEDSR
ncbi:hypothetical protein EV361DRAFT_870214 [Lentinula raphanica]|nr:hypothetical protein EV361DRAFT_870214 [Lentinula raphanica]